ncbi:MAG: 3-methyl-2-oxobutanoate hydroxymethyltransferase [Candidatus Goldiibacteriota bacterium]
MNGINTVKKTKGAGRIVMLTAYEYLTASYLNKAGVDLILVGDSAGMVFSGYENTLPVTVEEIIYHTKAVKKGAGRTPVVSDMPFMSYQAGIGDAKKNAGRIIKESGADAVKLEGGAAIISQVKAVVSMGIPVMGHIGTQPQSVKQYGGYPVSGAAEDDKKRLVQDALALEKAGVFAIVAEKTASKAAKEITKAVSVPVIGIGSGPHCDGQVLVTQDLLGAFQDFKPSFVKRYENTAVKSEKALKAFINDVKNRKYPSKKYYF